MFVLKENRKSEGQACSDIEGECDSAQGLDCLGNPGGKICA
jgi:hypothetical protein